MIPVNFFLASLVFFASLLFQIGVGGIGLSNDKSRDIFLMFLDSIFGGDMSGTLLLLTFFLSRAPDDGKGWMLSYKLEFGNVGSIVFL